MRIKCVKEIHSEYITVGQEYNVYIDELQSLVNYRRIDNSCGSYMSIRSLHKHVSSGAIVVIGE